MVSVYKPDPKDGSVGSVETDFDQLLRLIDERAAEAVEQLGADIGDTVDRVVAAEAIRCTKPLAEVARYGAAAFGLHLGEWLRGRADKKREGEDR